MINNVKISTTGAAALTAGVAIFVMAIAAPFAELYVYPKLVIPGNAPDTLKNIVAIKQLFITFICDIIAAWALYIFLKPVNENLSLLAAWFRLIYTIIGLVAFLNLVGISHLLNSTGQAAPREPGQSYTQVMLYLTAFKSSWSFGILFFSIHLVIFGYLVFRSGYIPWILGILLMISGSGYLLTALKPLLLPGIQTDFAVYTFYGELVFMLWLIIKAPGIVKANLKAAMHC